MKLTLFSSILLGCCLNGLWTSGYMDGPLLLIFFFVVFFFLSLIFCSCYSQPKKIRPWTLLIEFDLISFLFFEFFSPTFFFFSLKFILPIDKSTKFWFIWLYCSTTVISTKVSQSRRSLREIHALHQHGIYGNV